MIKHFLRLQLILAYMQNYLSCPHHKIILKTMIMVKNQEKYLNKTITCECSYQPSLFFAQF